MLILFFEILIPAQMLIIAAYYEAEDEHSVYKGKCVFDHPAQVRSIIVKDSFITQMLNCIAFSLPLQQFISCFYVIPNQYGLFTEGKHTCNKNQTLELVTPQEEGEEPKAADNEDDPDKQDRNTI